MPKEYPITDFDMSTLPLSLQLMKAMIPFMNIGMQRTMSTFIRMQELQYTAKFYSNPNSAIVCSCSPAPDKTNSAAFGNSPMNDLMINTLLRYCPDNMKNTFNNMKHFTEMSDLFNMFNSSDASPSFSGMGQFFNSFGQGLTPEQQKKYNEYINKLDQLDFG
ncbi:MAG: hypothetical protein ACI4E1_06555 [Lachnospira sp.]